MARVVREGSRGAVALAQHKTTKLAALRGQQLPQLVPACSKTHSAVEVSQAADAKVPPSCQNSSDQRPGPAGA